MSNLAVDFGTVSIRGSAELAADGAIQTAKISQARVSPGDSLQADVTNGASAFKATVRGSTLDASPFLKALTASSAVVPAGAQGGEKDFDLDMKVATVTGANKQAIGGLELNLSRRGGEDRLNASGAASGRGRSQRSAARTASFG